MFFQIFAWVVIVLSAIGFSFVSLYLFVTDGDESHDKLAIRMFAAAYGFISGQLFGAAMNTFPF